MEIFSHIVKDDEVIGISPILIKTEPNSISYMMYGTFKYTFMVHCKQRSIEIESNWFHPHDYFTDKERQDEHNKKAVEWKLQYDKYKAIIKNHIENRP